MLLIQRFDLQNKSRRSHTRHCFFLFMHFCLLRWCKSPPPPPPRFTHDILAPLFVIVIPLSAVKRKSTFFAVSYLIFMSFLFIVEIGAFLLPYFLQLLPFDSRAVVAAVSVTVASDNLRTIKNSLTDKTEGLRTLSDLLDRCDTVLTLCMHFFQRVDQVLHGRRRHTPCDRHLPILVHAHNVVVSSILNCHPPLLFLMIPSRRYKKLIGDQAPPAPPPAPADVAITNV